MPKVDDVPKALKALAFHGVDFLDYEQDQVPANCPFCGKRKFSAHRDTGKWDCKVCGRTGNPKSFMEQVWDESSEPTEEFALDRSVLNVSSLVDIGVQRSLISGDVIVPSYGADGKLDNLYTYIKDHKLGKRILYPTPEFHAGLFGASLFDKKKKTLYIVEGPWKVAVLREILARAKRVDGTLAPTGNPDNSLLADANVLGVPGCNTWHESWNAYSAGKDVVILFDSDHPREVKEAVGSRIEPPTGWTASRRLVGKLAAITPPETIGNLKWGEEGFDPTLPSGYDIRDALKDTTSVRERVSIMDNLLKKVESIPREEWETLVKKHGTPGGEVLDTIECRSWPDLIKQWQKALTWSDGLDRALSVMLASVLSTDMMDAQLWIKIVSPPSTGKTQLCDGLAIARKRVRSVGNFTGLHSGFQTDAEGEEDHSLLSKIRDMTLVVKDGDTILKSPSREKILSQVRDAYDTNCAVAYGNRVKREYNNLRFTFILAGTEALLEMDSSDLGARYLDCIIMSKIDTEREEMVNKRGFHRVFNNRGTSANGDARSHGPNELNKAKAMTGGYVEYLRNNSAMIRSNVNVDNVDAIQTKISHLAQYIAHVRARPSKTQDEASSREMSARLNEQLTKLAICLAGAMGKKTIDKEVMRRVRQVAVDTGRGKIAEIVEVLAKDKKGMEAGTISKMINQQPEKTRALLRFFRSIDGVELVEMKVVGKMGIVGSPRWKLTPKMREIYNHVF